MLPPPGNKEKLGDTSLLYDERYLFEYQQNYRESIEKLAFLLEIINFEWDWKKSYPSL